MALYAFDGTWNKERTAGEYGRNTNVVLFRDAYLGNKKFYQKGVGTKLRFLGKLFGGAFGAGGHGRIADAYKELCACWLAGDTEIDIVGFSRGAALALAFTNHVVSKGIRDPKGSKVIAKPAIRFLGLWDVVGSFGIPIDLGPVEFQHINLGYKLTLPNEIRYAFHAMALDERRQTFRVTRVTNAVEVWFRGCHSDVGGGNQNRGLSDIALRWMLRKASASGLPISAKSIAATESVANPATPIRIGGFDVYKNPFREIRQGDRFHYTVTFRQDCNNVLDNSGMPVRGCRCESAADELGPNAIGVTA